MTGENQTTKRLERLNLILRTIRSVDQVLLEEKDCGRLVQGICDSLVRTRGYYNAWIALMDQTGKFTAFAEAGLGKNFLPLAEQLQREGATECGKRALAQSRAVVTNDPASSCLDCPLAEGYRGRGGITARLIYRGRLYGLLCASIPASLVTEEEERSMFEDVAGDVAFALYETELEENHKRVEKALERSENRYRALFNSASDGMFVRNLEGSLIMANDAMSELSGYTIDELVNMNISQFLSASSVETTFERQKRQLEDKSEAVSQRYELQLLRKDGTERVVEVVNSLLSNGEQFPIVQTITRDITEQKRARENLRAYASRAILAQEEERKRVARELHDETAQALASLGMDLDYLAKTRRLDSSEVSKNLEKLRDRANDILTGVRSLSQALRPPMLEEFGLLETLRYLADDLNGQRGINIDSEVKGTPRRLPPDVELAIFRIVQEALTNVGKHSQATQGKLEVEFAPEKVTLMVSDNGRGFELPQEMDDTAYSGKLGLTGMRERAKLIDGSLKISSEPGKGTTLVLEVSR